MDDRISAVLDIYQARMLEERKRPRETRPELKQTDRDARLLPVGPETGRLINLIARSLESPTILEIGASYGYSAIWLAEAARASGGRLISMELLDYKVAYARRMSEQAGLADHVDFQVGDAVQMIANLPGALDFVLLDTWKDSYLACLEVFFPKLAPGAVIVADNMIRPGGEHVAAYARTIRAKPGITSIQLPVGAGIEVSRYQPV